MLERRISHLWQSVQKRRASRRAVVPPELLEPRNAPGACLYLSWLLDALVTESSDSTLAGAIDRSVVSSESFPIASSGLGSPSEDDTSKPSGGLDELSLLGDAESLRIEPNVAPRTRLAPALVSPSADNLLSTLPPSATVHGAVSTKLPSLDTPKTIHHETPRDAPILKFVAPVANPLTSGSSGGGGSSSSMGGGPPAGGGARAATLSRPHSAVTTAAPAVSIEPVPPVLAVQAADGTPPSFAAPSQSLTSIPAVKADLAATSPVAASTLVPTSPDVVPVVELPVAADSLIEVEQSPATPLPGATITPAPAVAPAIAPTTASIATHSQNFSLAALNIAGPIITQGDVEILLDRASAATSRNDAIIAVVDRGGRILGVRVESGVPIDLDSDTMVFAIDGAVAKARTAAFFSSDAAPLTSRTVRFISQSTIAQREVESNPNDADPTKRGPGFVAPIGVGGHFPPGVRFTPQVDLFAIEHTNRDGLIHPGKDAERGTLDDISLDARFGADFAYGADVPAPESYGIASGSLMSAQARGIATLPGGMPLFKRDPDDMNRAKLVGGIGVFFPGPDGYATFEQNFQHSDARIAAGKRPQTNSDRLNAPLVKQAEYMAFAAAGGVGAIAGIPLPADYVVLPGRIDLAGITLEIYGPHPHGAAGLLAFGAKLGTGDPNGSTDMPVTSGGDLHIDGQSVPDGWLVEPRSSGNLTADEVRKIIEDGVAEAMRVRAAIRLPLGSRTQMVLSVTDTNGEILGLYRMPDATFFSIDVAVAKARNVAYYADADALQPEDQVDGNFDGNPDLPAGTALTNRTFRYLATPFFPTGVDTAPSGPFSILNDPGINPRTAENIGAPLPADQYTSALGYDAFNPGTNFRELSDPGAVPGNQNGVVFFPGSTPLYKNGQLVGGLGVSGDGVDQDDVVTFSGAGNFLPRPNSDVLRADETFVRGVRLPYQKFSRNPRA